MEEEYAANTKEFLSPAVVAKPPDKRKNRRTRFGCGGV
jgi:hypothetical protein